MKIPPCWRFRSFYVTADGVHVLQTASRTRACARARALAKAGLPNVHVHVRSLITGETLELFWK